MFEYQNYKTFMFIKVGTLLNPKTDANMMLTHFHLNITCFNKQTLLTLVIYYGNITLKFICISGLWIPRGNIM